MQIKIYFKPIFISVASLVLAAVVLTRPDLIKRPYCSAISGRWASVPELCYSQSCFKNGDCGGPWVSTAIPCSEVRLGETEAMLHFYFGNPDKRNGNHVLWSTGKPDRSIIEGIFTDEKLVELKCPPPS
jgi:hypothetical protein